MDKKSSKFRWFLILLAVLNVGGCLASFYFGTSAPRINAYSELFFAGGFALLGGATTIIGIALTILYLMHRINRSPLWGIGLAVVGLVVALGLAGDVSLINSCQIHRPCF